MTKEVLRQTRDALEEAQAALNGAPNTQGLHSQIDAALRAAHFELAPTNNAPGSAGQNVAHTEGVHWALMSKDLVVHAEGPWTTSIATVHRPEYARLIAAAPDLLEACRTVLCCDIDPQNSAAIRAAIAKATGEGV